MSTFANPSVRLGGTDYSPQIGAATLNLGQQEFKRAPLNSDGEHTCYGLKTDGVSLEIEDDASNTLQKYLLNNRGSEVAIVIQVEDGDVSQGEFSGNVLIPGISPTLRAGGEKKFSVSFPVVDGVLDYTES